jgi:hypothetical protein
MGQQAGADSMNDVPDSWLFDYPHLIGIVAVMVVLTLATDFWTERRRPAREQVDAPPLSSLLVLIPIVLLHGFFVWFLPAAVIVGAWQYLVGVPLTPASYSLEYGSPIVKLALVLCLLDNCIQIQKHSEPRAFVPGVVEILIFITLGYPGALVLAWSFAVVLAASGMFQTARIDVAREMFAIPAFFGSSALNLLASFVLGVISSVVAHWIIEGSKKR